MSAQHLRDDVEACFRAAVRGVQPAGLMAGFDLADHLERSPEAYRRMVLLGTGKASMAMAGVLEAHLPESRPLEGLATVPHGYAATLPADVPAPRRVEVVEAGHPVPDAAGEEAARRALTLAEGCGPDDLMLVLVSGGGSALWPAPPEGVTLEDVQATVRLLLGCGAAIDEVNAVRKHLSRIGGGGLARAAHSAEVLALVLSDVVGDDPAVIASGPTTPDPSTFADAATVLRAHAIWDRVPPSVRRHLARGLEGAVPDTPGAGDPAFARTHTHLFGTNRDAVRAARREAERRGYQVIHEAHGVTGEAREVGPQQARRALAAAREADRPVAMVWGGETTVTVRGDGTGGRNQELALAAALALDGADLPLAFLSGGTDGIDGPTDAAGALVTPRTAAEARRRGLDPDRALVRNDAYPLLDAVGALLRPGPTHTNVMDVQLALLGRDR